MAAFQDSRCVIWLGLFLHMAIRPVALTSVPFFSSAFPDRHRRDVSDWQDFLCSFPTLMAEVSFWRASLFRFLEDLGKTGA